MTVVLDAGAFVAIERGDRDLLAIIKRERLQERAPRTHGGVVGQVWRSGDGRQARLARMLASMQVEALDEHFGKRIGALLGRARESDVIDAGVVLLADDGDEIYTSDHADIVDLAQVADVQVDVIPV